MTKSFFRSVSVLGALFSSTAILAACGDLPLENEATTAVAESSLAETTYYYLRCSATTWDVSEVNRLVPATRDGILQRVNIQVTQPWMVQNGDDCILTATNQKNGWGTASTSYGARTAPIVVPGGTQLNSAGGNFRVRYPSLGRYQATMNMAQGTLQIVPTPPEPVNGVSTRFVSDTEALVTWTAPANASEVVSYAVVDASGTKRAVASAASTSARVPGLVLGKGQAFTVNGLDRTGAVVAQSSAVMVARPVVVLVEADVRSALASELETYQRLISSQFGIEIRLDSSRPWSSLQPAQIRDYIRSQYTSNHLQGLILAGRIPYAVYENIKGPNNTQFHVSPLFYEHLDATFADQTGNGVVDEKTVNENDPTELWTAFWVPPFGDDTATSTIPQLRTFLQKSIAFHQGRNRGAGAFVGYHRSAAEDFRYAADEFRDVLSGAGGFDASSVSVTDNSVGSYEAFLNTLHSAHWSHAHVAVHGLPRGFYFGNGDYTIDAFDADSLRALSNGADFVSSSGCLNGNIKGNHDVSALHPEDSIALRFVFDAATPTVAFYGSTDSQSTGLNGSFHEPLFRAVRSDYVGLGYYNLKNSDVIWGSSHFMFRTVDDKALIGDPFYHY